MNDLNLHKQNNEMILRRLGNKKKIAGDIHKHFPAHKLYVEPFFGAGGMFFSKPKAKYNIVNDRDSDVYNLFNVVSEWGGVFYEQFSAMPIHEDLWHYWRMNKETDSIKKAMRFLFLSNFGYMGKSETLRFANGNTKQILLDGIAETNKLLFGVEFMNCDFRDVFKKIPVRELDPQNIFCYCDPPYLDTTNNYEHSFTEQDSAELFDLLCRQDFKWAMSEFDHPFIISQAEERKLFITTIGERQNMKNRRVEVLVTNYPTQALLF